MDLLNSLRRYALPPPEDRLVITRRNVAVVFVPYLLMLGMAGLTRTPGTRLLRMALTPLAIVYALHYGFIFGASPTNPDPISQALGQSLLYRL